MKCLVMIRSLAKPDEITIDVCQKKMKICIQVRALIFFRTITSACDFCTVFESVEKHFF